MNENFVSIILVGVWVSVLTISIVVVNTRWINPATRIVTADIVSLVKEKIVQLAKQSVGKKDTKKQAKMMRKITQKLEWTLKKIAHQNNVIIVPRQAVLAGSAEDVTHLLRKVLGLGNSPDSLNLTLSVR